MKKITNTLKALWKDESAQGMTEYILLVVVVLGLAYAFKPKILAFINDKTEEIGGSLKGFGNGQ